jgi:CheY-like chemotaxis protein
MLLELDGHRVVTASGGEAALAELDACVNDGRRFDLLITDLGMSDIDGIELIGAARARQSDLRCILATGWGAQVEHDQSAGAGITVVLTKPVTLTALRTAIEDAMRAAPSRADDYPAPA